MWNAGFMTEFARVITMIQPQTINGAGVDSIYVDMSKYERLLIALAIGNRAGVTTPALTITQATSNAGAGDKALNFDTYYYGTISNAVDALTAGTSSSNTFNINASVNQIYLVDLTAKMLDKNNSFRWVAAHLATPGANNVPLSCLGVLYDGIWAGKPTTLPTVVA